MKKKKIFEERMVLMMKKLSLILAVLLLVPAMAAVTIDGTDNGDLTADVTYSADANVSAFALEISVDAGSIVGFTPAMTGECTAAQKGYGIFPGSIDINDTTGVIDNVGTPVVAVDADTIIIEMGALYVDGNQPPKSGAGAVLGTLEVTEGCHVTITAEPVRGGIVYTDATAATLADGEFDIAGASAGIPGDADDSGCVNFDDFIILKNTYGLALGQGGYDARADFDDSDAVNFDDFIILKNNYGTCQ